MTRFETILGMSHMSIDPAMSLMRPVLDSLKHACMNLEPDVLIGGPDNPYMRRWWIVPRNKYPFNVYMHHIMRSDDARALHDHPWNNVSFLIEGQYLEHMQHGILTRTVGQPVFRVAKEAHRIELIRGEPCWSLFITGAVEREWGFLCPQGWVSWQRFTGPDSTSMTGPGCD